MDVVRNQVNAKDMSFIRAGLLLLIETIREAGTASPLDLEVTVIYAPMVEELLTRLEGSFSPEAITHCNVLIDFLGGAEENRDRTLRSI